MPDCAAALKAIDTGAAPAPPGESEMPIPQYDEPWIANVVRPAVVQKYADHKQPTRRPVSGLDHATRTTTTPARTRKTNPCRNTWRNWTPNWRHGRRPPNVADVGRVLARQPIVCRLLHRHLPRLTWTPDGVPAWECLTCLRRWRSPASAAADPWRRPAAVTRPMDRSSS